MRVHLGPIGHFTLTVSDPEASAAWWTKSFNLDEVFRREDRILLANNRFALVLVAGEPDPGAFGHMAFDVPDEAALRAALAELRESDVELEDPGDEIGPVAPGSPRLGLWFHDPDGYRWELVVARTDA